MPPGPPKIDSYDLNLQKRKLGLFQLRSQGGGAAPPWPADQNEEYKKYRLLSLRGLSFALE